MPHVLAGRGMRRCARMRWTARHGFHARDWSVGVERRWARTRFVFTRLVIYESRLSSWERTRLDFRERKELGCFSSAVHKRERRRTQIFTGKVPLRLRLRHRLLMNERALARSRLRPETKKPRIYPAAAPDALSNAAIGTPVTPTPRTKKPLSSCGG